MGSREASCQRAAGSRQAPQSSSRQDTPWLRIIGQGLLLSLTVPAGVAFLIWPETAERLTFEPALGVFLVNFLLNLPVVPLPGTSSLGQLVIIRQAAASDVPWLIGLTGGLGMGFGEIPPYFLGSVGRDVTKNKSPPTFLGIDRAARLFSSWVTVLMNRWDVLVVFLLAVIPNPFLEISALSAGATRIPLRRFIPALVAGKIGRGLILVAIGAPFGFL